MNIINAYFTDGYIEWAKLFIKSYTYHNGEDDKMIICSRNLNSEQQVEIFGLRNNIEVRNINLDFNKLSKKAKVNKNQLLEFKKQVETVKVSGNNKVWKLMIAGDDRIKSIYNIMNNEIYEGSNLIHFDVDMYVTGKITKIIDIAENNDVSTIFRIEKQMRRRGKVFREHRAVLINIQTYKINERSRKFVKRWIKYIDDIPPIKRPKGYGQTSYYYAWKDLNKEVDFGHIPREYQSFGSRKNSFLWTANMGSKSERLKECQNHFKKIK